MGFISYGTEILVSRILSRKYMKIRDEIPWSRVLGDGYVLDRHGYLYH